MRLLWMALGWLELTLLSLLLYPLSFLPKHWLENGYRKLFQHWCRVWVHALGVDLRLHQKNQHRLPERFLLIANHPSAFEDIGIPALFDVDCLAKSQVKSWPIVGRISAAAGTLFVNRKSKESRVQASQEIIQALQSGRNIALYPEGGVKGKRLHDNFRYGVFSISLETGLPIVPVYIHYESMNDFHWDKQHLVRKIIELMQTRNNHANYYLYDAFHPENFEDRESYSRHVHQRYLEWQQKYLD